MPSRAHQRIALALAAGVLAGAASAPTAGAAISFVAKSSAGNGAGASALSIARPGGTAAGDLLVATVVARGTAAINQPSGWTIARETVSGYSRMVTSYRVAAGGEAGSYTWGLGATRKASAGIATYRGVNTSLPIEATADATGSSGNATAPSVTTVTPTTLVLTTVGIEWQTTVTPAAGTSERFDQASSGWFATTTALADAPQATAGPTPARTAQPAITGAGWAAQTIVLRDAAQATLEVEAGAVTPFTASLEAGDTSADYTLPLTVTDTRMGASASQGWNLTITSTPFTNAVAKTLLADASTLTAATIGCLNGSICDAPANGAPLPVGVPAGTAEPAAVKVFSAAAGRGEGVMTLSAPVTVSIPQNSYSGEFASTITVSVVSGP